MPSIADRLKNAWNAFNGRDQTLSYMNYGVGTGYRPDRSQVFFTNDQSIIKAVSTRIAIDAAQITIEHARLDYNRNYLERIESKLGSCLTVSANIDQTGRAFMQDVYMSMFDEGVVAIIPVDTRFPSNVIPDPEISHSFDVRSLRTGKVIQWYPKHVKVRVYNEESGKQEDIIVGKSYTAIVENPLYSIMNEPNSTFQRLIRTYNDLDAINRQNASGKLDLIIQLPYQLKTELQQNQARHRKQLLEEQLTDSKYGVAYLDATEKIIQLNRPLENNLWAQAKELNQTLYNQLGLTQSVFEGTADEATMNNYYKRTVEPVVSAVVDEMKRKFLSTNAISSGESIIYFNDPFKFVPTSQFATIAETLLRNAAMSPNEVRGKIGLRPDENSQSDELRNRNISQSEAEIQNEMGAQEIPEEEATSEQEEPQEVEETSSGTSSIDEWIALLNGDE